MNAGFHSGAILLTAPGAESVQVELSYTINVPPILMVDPAEIVRQDALAGGPVELELKVINAEFGTMTWTVNEFSPWITLEPTSGSAVTGHPGRVAVTLDPSALSAGLHEADITVSAAGASGSPKTVHVARIYPGKPEGFPGGFPGLGADPCGRPSGVYPGSSRLKSLSCFLPKS